MAKADNQGVNEAVKSEIRQALVNHKAIACPMAVRLAWHMSGTFDAETGSGGSNGATLRFEPEISDPANAGLGIIRDLLHDVRKAHPEISCADLWTAAGAVSVEFLGGPEVRPRPPAANFYISKYLASKLHTLETS